MTSPKRLTNCLPTLSVISLSPGVAARSDIRADVSISTRLHFLGISGRLYFQVRHGKRRKSLKLVDGGIRTHDPKTTRCLLLVKELGSIINSPFDHLQKVNQLPT